jgi:hypothetical protein
MPTICRFYGILVQMYYDDHNSLYFHGIYGHNKAVIAIGDLAILEGDLPPKAVGLVMEWAKAHKGELMKEWEPARQSKTLFPIDPLE